MSPGAYSLAFPAFGTSKDHGFPAEKAAPVVMQVVNEFLKKNQKVSFFFFSFLRWPLIPSQMSRLQLVLVEPDEAVLAVFKKHAASVTDKRFSLRGGDITTLATKDKFPCRYIASATTWRFKTTAHPASKAVADAASGILEDAKKRYTLAKVSKAYPVAVAPSTVLNKREVRYLVLRSSLALLLTPPLQGVRYVICVAAPVCIKGKPDAVDEEQAADLLKTAHIDLFERFLELTR